MSTGMTGNVGGPQQPTIFELETTAINEVMKTLVGIMPDSLDKPVSQLDYEATWKYKSTSSNPTLAPMIRVRVSTAPPDPSNDEVAKEFNRLLDMLPPDIRQEYADQAKLPADQRSPVFASLDNVLGLAAGVLAWLKAASKPMDPAQAALTHLDANKALPSTLRQNFIHVGMQILAAANAFLKAGGHALPNFDKLSQVTTDLGGLFTAFQSAQASGAGPEAWSALAKKFASLENDLDSLSGEGLQALGPMLSVMVLIASAAAMEGAGPAMLALCLATESVGGKSDSVGVLPAWVQQAVHDLSGALLATSMPDAGTGSKKLLPVLITGLLLGAASLAVQGGGNKALDLELGLLMIVHSGLLSETGNAIADASGASESIQPIMGKAVACAALLLLIQVSSETNKGGAGSLADSLSGPLSNMLKDIEQYTADHVHASGTTDPLAHALNVFTLNARLALEEHNTDAFAAALNDVKDLIASQSNEKGKGNQVVDKLVRFVQVLSLIVGAKQSHSTDTGVVMA